MRSLSARFACIATFILGLVLVSATPFQAQAQDDSSEGIVKFERDVKPILEAKCFRCHGGETTEGLDLNDAAALGDYLVAGEPGDSDFYLRLIADEDSIMPPIGEGGPLPGAEIATLKVWIEEGAHWPQGMKLGVAGETVVPAEPELPAGFVPYAERSLPSKLWAIHGWFHPAVVHFPIALFTVGALFVILNGLFKANFREFAFWCLLIGSLGAIASCTMGWAFAVEKSASGDEVFWHRWGGIIVAVWSSLVTILALRLKSSDKGLSQAAWQGGLLLSAAMVGLVGHQGGELVYGEHMYQRAFEKYFPSEPADQGEGSTSGTSEAAGDGAADTAAETQDEAAAESEDDSADSQATGSTDSTDESTESAPQDSGSAEQDSSSSTEAGDGLEGASVEAVVPEATPATDPPTGDQ